MITLHKYVPFGDTPDISPFCIKMETYLRMTGRPYVTKVGDPRKAPKGKLPVVEVDGEVLADSRLIIERLEAKGDALDTHLDAKQRALLTAVRAMIEEHFYWVGVYFRWKDEAAWAKYVPTFRRFATEAKVPRPIVPLMLPLVRRKMLAALHAQGTGRHAHEDVVKIGKDIVDSLAELLGDGPFFFGDRPSTLDATVYAFLIAMLHAPLDSPLREHARTRPNVTAYVDRMKARYWEKGASA